MVFGEDLRCLIERLVLRILLPGWRFESDDADDVDEQFRLVFVDEHLSLSPELAANVASAWADRK